MLATFNGFSVDRNNANYKIVFVSQVIEDDYTGLTRNVKRAYICLSTVLFKDLIGKQVELTLAKSEKLNKSVVTGIREVK